MANTTYDQVGTSDEVFGEEYEHEPVPMHARRSTFSVATVWVGFPMIITGAMTGSILVANLGFARGAWAMLVARAAHPMTLSTALCRPTSSRATSSSRLR